MSAIDLWACSIIIKALWFITSSFQVKTGEDITSRNQTIFHWNQRCTEQLWKIGSDKESQNFFHSPSVNTCRQRGKVNLEKSYLWGSKTVKYWWTDSGQTDRQTDSCRSEQNRSLLTTSNEINVSHSTLNHILIVTVEKKKRKGKNTLKKKNI